MLRSARAKTGRRPGSGDSRAQILDASRQLFAERGYDATSVRAVAAAARVDPALVLHFFGSKAELFAASLDLPVHPAEIEALLEGPRGSLGRRIASFYLRKIFGERRRTALSLVRSSVSNPEAAEMLRRALQRIVVAVLERKLRIKEAPLRAELCASHMLGLFLAREILRIEPLSSEGDDRLVEILAPTLQRYLSGPLPRARRT